MVGRSGSVSPRKYNFVIPSSVRYPARCSNCQTARPALCGSHMISAALALLLLPVIILVRRRPEFHRPLGRLLGFFVVIDGLTARRVTVVSHAATAPLAYRVGIL